MELRPENDVSYLSLFRVAGFGRFATTTLLGRGAQAMWVVTMVLFVLQKFHSAGLAGLVVFFGVFPALAASPPPGALFDPHPPLQFLPLPPFPPPLPPLLSRPPSPSPP